MLDSRLLLKVLTEISNRLTRNQYEELLVELDLYTFSTLKDDEDYYGRSKRDLILDTLRTDGHQNDIITGFQDKYGFSKRLLSELELDGFDFDESEDEEEDGTVPNDRIAQEKVDKVIKSSGKIEKAMPVPQKADAPQNFIFVEHMENSQITQGSKIEKDETTIDERNKKRLPIELILGILALAGVIITALVSYISGKTQVEIPIQATMTAEAKQTQAVILTSMSLPTSTSTLAVLPGSHAPPSSPGGGIVIETPPVTGVRLQIPAIMVDCPIVQGDDWEELKKGAGQHIGSVNPGENGNLILTGLNDLYGEIFRNLDKLKEKDECVIRSMSASESGGCRPPIPEHAVHPIRGMSSTF